MAALPRKKVSSYRSGNLKLGVQCQRQRISWCLGKALVNIFKLQGAGAIV